jgi:hypothetical protein
MGVTGTKSAGGERLGLGFTASVLGEAVMIAVERN